MNPVIECCRSHTHAQKSCCCGYATGHASSGCCRYYVTVLAQSQFTHRCVFYHYLWDCIYMYIGLLCMKIYVYCVCENVVLHLLSADKNAVPQKGEAKEICALIGIVHLLAG